VIERFKHDGSIPTGTTPEEFAAFIQKEAKLWGDIVKLEPELKPLTRPANAVTSRARWARHWVRPGRGRRSVRTRATR
jgi:hypothetical protein